MQDDLNKKILNSLLEFARKSAFSFMSREEDWASRMRANEIPVAALVLGEAFLLFVDVIKKIKNVTIKITMLRLTVVLCLISMFFLGRSPGQ